MKCIKCGRPVGASRYCNACGFDNKHIAKALNTADYYYNIGLEKAQMHDLSGAEIYLKKALNYNKSHKNARNLLGLVYNEMGEGGKCGGYITCLVHIRKAERPISNGRSAQSFLL